MGVGGLVSKCPSRPDNEGVNGPRGIPGMDRGHRGSRAVGTGCSLHLLGLAEQHGEEGQGPDE